MYFKCRLCKLTKYHTCDELKSPVTAQTQEDEETTLFTNTA